MAHVARGLVLWCTKRPGDAMAAFERAVRLDPGSASAHAGRGFALAALGRREDALSAYERAVRLDPGSASAHAGRGLVLEALGRREDALSAYERAFEIDGYHALAIDGRSRAGRGGAPSGARGPGSPRRESLAGGPGSASARPGRRDAHSAIACRAIDPDFTPAPRYIEHCLSYAPREGRRHAPRVDWERLAPLTADEISGIKESESSCAVSVGGSEFVDMITREAEIAEGAKGKAPRG